MRVRCLCGAPVPYDFEQLGCIECGWPCCPVCGYVLESAWYCARCAGSLLEIPTRAPDLR